MKKRSRAWGDRRLIVFAGAGISAVPPSDLPSWWHFNVAVLDGVREVVKGSYELPDEALVALDELTLDDVGVTLFSQVVADGFAGASWFELLGHLDGTTPGPCHDALASLADEGLLAGIVTTNFDTLIERAFGDRGVPLDVYVPSDGVPPPADLDDAGACRLVKVHGSVGEHTSMIDLASQKARGLPPLLRAWLSRVFAEHPLLVAGFSGADLSLAEDYFGLTAALPQIPWLRWVTRGDRPPLPTATAAVGATPDGSFVEGELPGVLVEIDLDVPSPRVGSAESPTKPRDWVEAWLTEPGSSPEACAALSARLLDISGRGGAAASIRDTVRAEIKEKLAGGVTLAQTLPASLALAQFGSDLVGEDPEQALADLSTARKINELFLSEGVIDQLSEASRLEQRNNAAGVIFNIGMAYLALSKPAEAEQALADTRTLVEAMPLEIAAKHRARAFHLSGMICRLREHNREALLDWRQASLLAEAIGLTDVALSSAENRWRTLALLGEVDLAKKIHAEAERLRTTVVGVRPPAEDLDLEWGDKDRREVFETLVGRLEAEARLGGGRLDEILYSLWMASEGAPDLRDALRDALSRIGSSELDGMEPLQRALVAIARHALAEGDDLDLLEPAPVALSEWFSARLSGEYVATIPEARLVLHPDLADAVTWLARRWAQTGIERQREEAWEEAERQFAVGGCAFALAGEKAEAVRALLYSVDAIARLERFDDAEALLDWLGLGSGPQNTADVLSRHIKLLAYRASNEEIDADEADGALERARRLLRRLESIDGVDEDVVAAGFLSAGSLHYFTGHRQEAIELVKRAEELFVDEEHKQAARFNLEQIAADEDDVESA